MKRLLASIAVIALATCNYSLAAEKKPLRDVDNGTLVRELQVQARGSGDNHVALVSWIPKELWQTTLARDTTTSEADKEFLLETMSGISLLAVFQADISQFGAFNFYTKEEIEGNMKINLVDSAGVAQNLSPLSNISPDLEIFLADWLPPVTSSSSFGRVGDSIHFYVLSDLEDSSSRLIDPYQEGNLNVRLSRRDSAPVKASFELTLNSLFIPRKCPNGKDAHISWNYCPWSGKLLEG